MPNPALGIVTMTLCFEGDLGLRVRVFNECSPDVHVLPNVQGHPSTPVGDSCRSEAETARGVTWLGVRWIALFDPSNRRRDALSPVERAA